VRARSLLLEAVELLQGCHREHGTVRFRLRECLQEQRKQVQHKFSVDKKYCIFVVEQEGSDQYTWRVRLVFDFCPI
jgi:predicted metal-dependent hydrolase